MLQISAYCSRVLYGNHSSAVLEPNKVIHKIKIKSIIVYKRIMDKN